MDGWMDGQVFVSIFCGCFTVRDDRGESLLKTDLGRGVVPRAWIAGKVKWWATEKGRTKGSNPTYHIDTVPRGMESRRYDPGVETLS